MSVLHTIEALDEITEKIASLLEEAQSIIRENMGNADGDIEVTYENNDGPDRFGLVTIRQWTTDVAVTDLVLIHTSASLKKLIDSLVKIERSHGRKKKKNE